MCHSRIDLLEKKSKFESSLCNMFLPIQKQNKAIDLIKH
jgi:hypothetical protein